MRPAVFCFRPLLLAVAGLLWRSTLISGQDPNEYTYKYAVGTNIDALTIFASAETNKVTRKFTVTNRDTKPLQISLYHNYTLEGSHVFNFRHHIYPHFRNDDPASHQNLASTSTNPEWVWANRTFGGQNVPHWYIVQHWPGLTRRRLEAVDFASLFAEVSPETSLSDPRPSELSAVIVRVAVEDAAVGLPQGCSTEEGSERMRWNQAITCENAEQAAVRLGCRPTLTELHRHEYYFIRVPEECSSVQLRIWLEALSEDLPIVEAHPNTRSQRSFSEEAVAPNPESGVASSGELQRVASRADDDPFAMTDNLEQTACYKEGTRLGRNMVDWSTQYDSKSVYLEKQAQKNFSFVPVAFIISPYANLKAFDPNFLNMAYIMDETDSSTSDDDGDGVKGNRYGMYYQNNQLVGAGLWDKPGDSRTLGFFSAAFGRTESGFTLGAAPLTKYYTCAAGAPGEATVQENGVLLCLKWLQDNHRRLNITMIVHAYDLEVNWDFPAVYSDWSPILPQFAISPLSSEADDPPAGKREVSWLETRMPASFSMDRKDWGTAIPCSERAGNGTASGGWAGSYSVRGQSCMYQSFSYGCIQTGPTSIEIGNRKLTALAWMVGQFALLQHYNRVAKIYDYRLLSYAKGVKSANSPAGYWAPGVSEILKRFDPANDHMQGLEKEFVLQPGESKEMLLDFLRTNAASGVNDPKSEYFANRVGNIEVYASDVIDGAGPMYLRAGRIPYRLDWGEEDETMPRWYLGED